MEIQDEIDAGYGDIQLADDTENQNKQKDQEETIFILSFNFDL